MLQLRRNEILGPNNQKLQITLSSGGSAVVPTELHYALFELNSPEKVVDPIKFYPESADKQPVAIFTDVSSGGGRVADGNYIATLQMPHDAILGRTKVVWYYKTHASQASYATFEEEFEVIDYIDAYGSQGVPAVAVSEIRTFLRDKPEYHVLIDNVLFKDSEILTALDQVVGYFNRLNPPLGTFTASTFPDKYLLTLGVTAWLFDSEANRQLMEQLTYQDGNIHHGITDKTQLYRTAAANMKNEFMSQARELKLHLNMNAIYSGAGLGIRFRPSTYGD